MQSKMQAAGRGRSTALIRLLGLGAAAALFAVLWTAAGAAAQNAPAVTAEYMGWAADIPDPSGPSGAYEQVQQESIFQIVSVAEGSDRSVIGQQWECRNVQCHYLRVSWSGLAENLNSEGPRYTFTLTRDAPSAEDIGVAEDQFGAAGAATEMAKYMFRPSYISVSSGYRYLPVPWPNEEVRVTVSSAPGSAASDVVRIPATDLPAAFASRAAQHAATLVAAAESSGSSLPRLVIVWPKVEGATHYELQYTVRTRSNQAGQRLMRTTRIVRAFNVPGALTVAYESLQPDWSGHWNSPVLSALTNASFGDAGDWFGVVTTLPWLLGGAAGWPQETVDGESAAVEADIVTALSAGRNAVGVRIRAMAACADFDTATHQSLLCSQYSKRAGPLALRGKQGRISYVKFKGENAAAWIGSARTTR